MDLEPVIEKTKKYLEKIFELKEIIFRPVQDFKIRESASSYKTALSYLQDAYEKECSEKCDELDRLENDLNELIINIKLLDKYINPLDERIIEQRKTISNKTKLELDIKTQIKNKHCIGIFLTSSKMWDDNFRHKMVIQDLISHVEQFINEINICKDWLKDYMHATYPDVEKLTGISDSTLQEKWKNANTPDGKPIVRTWQGRTYWNRQWINANLKANRQ